MHVSRASKKYRLTRSKEWIRFHCDQRATEEGKRKLFKIIMKSEMIVEQKVA